jgi:twitching motility protein PilT
MRPVETLLGIVEMKRADGLVLALGEVPALLLGGKRTPLTMPTLSPEMMEPLLHDALSPDELGVLRERGVVDTSYASSAYGAFSLHAQSSGPKVVLTLRRGASKKADDARAKPGAAAVASTPLVAPAREADVHEQVILEQTRAVEQRQAQAHSPFDDVLDEAVERRASDVILSSGRPPLLRVDGALAPCRELAPTTSAMLEALLTAQLTDERRRDFAALGSVDFALRHTHATGSVVRFRANAFRHEGGLAVALRTIPAEIPSLAQLHLPAALTQLVEQRSGLVLFTGPTGSGKSSSLAALLEHVNRTRAAHIVTLEDPVEFVYQGKRAIVHQREIGQHVADFASGLRAALRETPDVLLVGEVRDPETIRMTLTAALTGHLVLSTVHSGGAIMAIERMIDAFPESEKLHVRQDLATCLRHVVAQQLVPATGGGRLPAVEILTVNHAIAAQIRDGRTHLVGTHLEAGADDGMVPMTRALANLVRSGRVARSTALAASDHREALEKLLDERGAGRRS